MLFRSSDEVQAAVALTQLKVLSVVPLSVIPPPSAVILDGDAVSPRVILISSTDNVVELMVTVVPLTVKFPPIVTSELNVETPETFRSDADVAPSVLNPVTLKVVAVVSLNVVIPAVLNTFADTEFNVLNPETLIFDKNLASVPV